MRSQVWLQELQIWGIEGIVPQGVSVKYETLESTGSACGAIWSWPFLAKKHKYLGYCLKNLRPSKMCFLCISDDSKHFWKFWVLPWFLYGHSLASGTASAWVRVLKLGLCHCHTQRLHLQQKNNGGLKNLWSYGWLASCRVLCSGMASAGLQVLKLGLWHCLDQRLHMQQKNNVCIQ